MTVKTPTDREFHVPTFAEIHEIERQAHELRAAEIAHLARAAVAWVRGVLHIGHSGSAVTH